jgi:hypothetical protein
LESKKSKGILAVSFNKLDKRYKTKGENLLVADPLSNSKEDIQILNRRGKWVWAE